MAALSNKIAIVTGASSGIGHAAAKLFAQEGAKVVVAARRKDELDKLVDEISASGGEAIACAGDVKDEALHQHLADTAQRAFGGLDIAFNNAGTLGEMGPTPQVSLTGWNDALATNLTSASRSAVDAPSSDTDLSFANRSTASPNGIPSGMIAKSNHAPRDTTSSGTPS
jgi:NAD(P)-dependent dehydrogenase (short-subunit alcohol dehydrogenase family)